VVYSRIEGVDNVGGAGVRTKVINRIDEGKVYLFSEPHLRFSELIEATTEADLT